METETVRRDKLYYSLSALKTLFNLINFFIGVFVRPQKRKISEIKDPLLLNSACELCSKIKRRELKCETLVRVYINRIEQVQPSLNAVVDNRFAEAIEEAKQIDEKLGFGTKNEVEELLKLPFLGIPFTCKDSICVKGCAWTAGSVYRRGTKGDQDAPVVETMRKAGAILVAITNVPEFLLFWDSNNKLHGRTNNPYDLSRIPGGSSGGEASLIAAAGSVIGVGSDLGGSLRIPAHCCGIFGHRPTSNIISMDGMFPDVHTLEGYVTFGPLCRYATDLIPMLKVMTHNEPKLRLDETVDLTRIKIYYAESDGGNPLVTPVSSDVKRTMHKAIKHFSDRFGVEAEPVAFRELIYGLSIFNALTKTRDPRNLGDVCTVGRGQLKPFRELLKSVFGLSNHTLSLIITVLMENLPSSSRDSNFSKKCIAFGHRLKAKFESLLGENGVFIYPTLPEPAIKHNTVILKGFDVNYTTVFNVLEMPSTHCTFGLSDSGLPVGFQIMTLPFNDRLSIAMAVELEKEFGGWTPPCDVKLDCSGQCD